MDACLPPPRDLSSAVRAFASWGHLHRAARPSRRSRLLRVERLAARLCAWLGRLTGVRRAACGVRRRRFPGSLPVRPARTPRCLKPAPSQHRASERVRRGPMPLPPSPCRAVPCRAVPCRAVPCRAVPCRAVPWPPSSTRLIFLPEKRRSADPYFLGRAREGGPGVTTGTRTTGRACSLLAQLGSGSRGWRAPSGQAQGSLVARRVRAVTSQSDTSDVDSESAAAHCMHVNAASWLAQAWGIPAPAIRIVHRDQSVGGRELGGRVCETSAAPAACHPAPIDQEHESRPARIPCARLAPADHALARLTALATPRVRV